MFCKWKYLFSVYQYLLSIKSIRCQTPDMGVATFLGLSEDERNTLETWVRRSTTEQRLAQRARMLLEAAGKTTKEVVASLQVRPATVSKWRTRK